MTGADVIREKSRAETHACVIQANGKRECPYCLAEGYALALDEEIDFWENMNINSNLGGVTLAQIRMMRLEEINSERTKLIEAGLIEDKKEADK